jgi:hypothetical protein
MTFVIAWGGLLLAVLAGIVLDDISVRRQQNERRDVSPFDPWW